VVMAEKEIERQYRVARQTLSIHAFLRDSFHAKLKTAQSILLGCSLVFCATAFAGDDLYRVLGLTPSTSRVALGIASVIAFGVSILLLVVNWNEQWAQHREAADQWAQVVENFRSLRSEDGSWPETHRSHLNSAYWRAAREVVVIPERRFNRLKRRYLRKVALSELNSAYPGCPIPLLLAVLTFRDAAGALRKHKSNSSE
jgi:hypothetical protein